MSQNNLKQFTIYLPPEVLKHIKETARKEKRSTNSQIIWIIEQTLKKLS